MSYDQSGDNNYKGLSEYSLVHLILFSSGIIIMNHDRRVIVIVRNPMRAIVQ